MNGPAAQWLNYHHLRYFWVVAREGSVTRAAKKLRLTQPTVSAQLHALEEAIGEKLFHKEGRKLVLTDGGKSAMRFADEIFALGTELVDTVRGRLTGRPTRLGVGVADDVPKALAFRILEPALALPEPVRVVVHEGSVERLLADLGTRAIDIVISEASSSGEGVFNHALGETGLSVFATAPLAKRLRRGFPKSLDGAPLLLPTPDTVLRRQIDLWLEDRGIVPDVVAELQDAALLTVFGERGAGAFVAPDAIVSFGGDVRRVGALAPLRQRFYAITMERRLAHPAVQAIVVAAKKGELFPDRKTRSAGGDRS